MNKTVKKVLKDIMVYVSYMLIGIAIGMIILTYGSRSINSTLEYFVCGVYDYMRSATLMTVLVASMWSLMTTVVHIFTYKD